MKQQARFTPPPRLKGLTALVAVLATLLAAPAAALLVIPATTGPDACTQGGDMENNPTYLDSLPTPTQTGLAFTLTLTQAQLRNFVGDQTANEFFVSVYVAPHLPSGVGEWRNVWQSGGGISNIASESINITDLAKNTRYMLIIQEDDRFLSIRRCFKTRGEFSNAEQNINADGTLQFTGPLGGSRHGCFAVTRTPQDFKECMCWGTRGGARFNTTTATRMALGCQDSS